MFVSGENDMKIVRKHRDILYVTNGHILYVTNGHILYVTNGHISNGHK